MINGSNIWVHYVNSMDDLVKEYTEILKTKIICIPEDGGLYIRNREKEGEEMGEVKVINPKYSL
jgi:hypothetical protein